MKASIEKKKIEKVTGKDICVNNSQNMSFENNFGSHMLFFRKKVVDKRDRY